MTTHELLPASLFSNSLSSSTHLRANNPATNLPQLNFNFDDLRMRMSEFSARFDDFIERGRRKVLEERNLFRMSVASVQDQTEQTARAIDTINNLITSHAQTLSSQSAESAEMATTIASLTNARDANLATIRHLRAKLAETKRAVAERKEEQKRLDTWLDGMRGEDSRETAVWEGLLGARVESAPSAAAEEKLRFVFTGLGSSSRQNGGGGGKEASFVLDVGRAGYAVSECVPELEKDEVEGCVRSMSEGEDLAAFLKGMRGLFRRALGGGGGGTDSGRQGTRN